MKAIPVRRRRGQSSRVDVKTHLPAFKTGRLRGE